MIDAIVTPPAIVQSLASCGVQAAGVTIRYDDVLQSDIVTISPAAGVSERMFPCVRRAAWAKFDIVFDDPVLAKSYRDYDDKQARAELKAQSVEWLRSHGRLAGLPVFAFDDKPLTFVTKLERFCGYKPAEAIEPVAPSGFTLRRSVMKFPIEPRYECLLNALFASDLERHGINLGFVGNEAMSEPEK